MGALRAVRGMPTPGVEPAAAIADPPECVWIDPGSLLVDDSYQRNLSERSVTLIRRIIAEFSWASFKPPICARTDQGLEVIDGQHSAIAAASHPAVASIPVMVVAADRLSDRAAAFLGHNRNRLAMTPTQMHHAAVAAGDPDAVTIAQVADRARVRVLKVQPALFGPRETVAVAAIGALVKRQGAMRARQVLEVCADTGMTPVSMAALKAVEHVLFVESAGPTIKHGDLITAIRGLAESADRESRLFAATHDVPVWRGLAAVYLRRVARVRR